MLDENSSFSVEGTVIIDLPSYMTMLNDNELHAIRNSQQQNKFVVIAAGVNILGDLIFVTADGSLREVSRKQFPFKLTAVVPANYGATLSIKKTNFVSWDIPSVWAIDVSKHLLLVDPMYRSENYTR